MNGTYYYNNYDKYIISQPWKITFAGWETDTLRLQQNGWQLSAIQDSQYHSVQIAFNHPEFRIRGISEHIRKDILYDSIKSNSFVRDGFMHVGTRAMLASDFIAHTASLAPFSDFKPIDAEPQFAEMKQFMSQNMFFAPNLARTQEIIIPEQSVDDLLNMMLEKQASNRAELIKKRVREQGEHLDFNPRTIVHAQLVSIAA